MTGVDISEDMLAIARSNALDAGVAVDFRYGSTIVSTFQMKRSMWCLPRGLLHLDDPWQAVAEFRRVLSRGGCAVITTNGANPLARLAQPPRRGAHPAGLATLAAVTALNEVMTASFGFMWRRTRTSGRLYAKVFRVPVRPLYRGQVARMFETAGFAVERWDVKAGPFVREHRWIARKL